MSGRVKVPAPKPLRIQPKLAISAPTDTFEREADSISDRVTSSWGRGGAAAPLPIQRLGAGGSPVLHRAADLDESDEEEVIQRKARGSRPRESAAGVPGRLRNGRGGDALPGALRGEMERQFGYNFSNVRIHRDEQAHRLNDEVKSHAFTHGSDIYFARGAYAPQSAAGRKLLAHELTHTVQQSGGARGVQRKPREDSDAARIAKMTDEEKALERDQIRAAATDRLAEFAREAVKEPLTEEQERQVAGWKRKVRAALEALRAHPGAQEQALRVSHLRVLESLLEDPVFVRALFRNHYSVVLYDEALTKIGDPAATYTPEEIEHLQEQTRLARAGTKAMLLHLVFQPQEYAERGIDPEMLKTAEPTESELSGGGGGEGQGGDDPLTVEDRALLQQVYEAMPEGEGGIVEDEVALVRLLREMSDEELQQFLEFLGTARAPEGEEEALPVEKSVEAFAQLSPADRDVLQVNRELGATPGEHEGIPKELSLQFKVDAEKITEATANAQQISSDLDRIRALITDPNQKSRLPSLDLGFTPFLNEMAMFQGLLAGGASRSTAVQQAAVQLTTDLRKMQEELMSDLALAVGEVGLLAVAGGLSAPVAAPVVVARVAVVVRRIDKIRRQIDRLMRAYQVATHVQEVFTIVDQARDAFDQFKEWHGYAVTEYARLQKQLESLDTEEGVDEMLEQQEAAIMEKFETLIDETAFGDILGMLYIPDDATPEEVLKILMDLPLGVDALETMWKFYEAGKGEPTPDFPERLSVRAFKAGALLYPLVGYLASVISEQISQELSENDMAKRMGRIIPKLKRGPALKEKNRGFFRRLNHRGYEYNKTAIASYADEGAEELKKLIRDDETSGEWTSNWFRFTSRRELKELNRKFQGRKIKAKLKGKKKTAPAGAMEEDVPAPPFRLKFERPGRSEEKLTAKLEVNPVRSVSVERLLPADFANKPGLEVPFVGASKERAKALRDWLQDYGYELIQDEAGGEHIRIPGGDTGKSKKRPYLHINANGRIQLGIGKTDYTRFLNRLIADDSDLPEGYCLKSAPDGVYVSLKQDLGAAGHDVLGLDANRKLVVGKQKPVTSEIAPAKLKTPVTEGYTWDAAVDHLFASPVTGGEAFNDQGKTTAAKWKAFVGKEPKLQKRPKTLEGKLGYVVNARAASDALGTMHLPGLKKVDDKGHMIARRFGGLDDYDNLVPMKRSLNQFPGAWFLLEDSVAKTYKGKTAKPGHSVYFNVNLGYSSAETRRPNRFSVSWEELPPGQDAPTGAKSKRKVYDNA